MNNLSSEQGHILKNFHFLPHLFLLFFVVASLSSCGYTNPYVHNSTQETKTKTLHITTWQNRTNELGLESVYFRLFNAWFKKSGRIAVVFDENEADLKLIGEISSINLPGLFYNSLDEALEIKVKLTVNFALYKTSNNTILWQEKQYVVYEPFLLDPTGEETQYNKKRALLRIGDEIAEIIYLRTHEIVNNLP